MRKLGEDWKNRGVNATEIRESVAELFLPAMLYSPAIMSLPILLKDLRNWLDHMGGNL